MGRAIAVLFLFGISACCSHAQDENPAPPQTTTLDQAIVLTHRSTPSSPAEPKPAIIPLTVPKGTPIQVALDSEVRLRNVGQPLHAHLVQPIYAYDKLVIPVGAAVDGQVTRIEPVPGGQRFLDALDADFTPTRKIEVTFSDVILADGKHIPIHTVVTPGSGQVIKFTTAADAEKKGGVKSAASDKVKQAKEQARQEWETAMQQVKQPGKVRKVERYAISRLPVRPQYIDAGTVYFAELQQPLEFGSEIPKSDAADFLSAPLPPGSVVHTLLVTPLNSATSRKGDPVEAILIKPLFDGEHLILPEGSSLKGSVVQVQPARFRSRNGQLRIAFHELIPPAGASSKAPTQQIDANLEGIQSDKAGNVKLDSEGGAEATTPKTRYLQTGIAIGLAMASAGGDGDSGVANPAGNTANRVAGGANGFKLVGIALGVLVHSRAFGLSMGAYGAGMSIYTHFIARGREVIFPKNTAMDIGIGMRPAPAKPVSDEPRRDDAEGIEWKRLYLVR
ncbi:MAG TPA: hypothetical protein VGF61_25445 [Candidatus Acidoferrum sp.]|jgi:hypothetical protein